MRFLELLESSKLEFSNSLVDSDQINKLSSSIDRIDLFKEINKFTKNIDNFELSVIKISPDLYVSLCKSLTGDVNDRKVDDLFNLTQSQVVTVSYPWIDYEGTQDSVYQDGRHRASVAKRLGIQKIPVIICYRDIRRVPDVIRGLVLQGRVK